MHVPCKFHISNQMGHWSIDAYEHSWAEFVCTVVRAFQYPIFGPSMSKPTNQRMSPTSIIYA